MQPFAINLLFWIDVFLWLECLRAFSGWPAVLALRELVCLVVVLAICYPLPLIRIRRGGK